MSGRASTGIIGVILAGGLARRMGGGDKAMIEIAGKPIMQHILDRQMAGLDAIIINANGDPRRFQKFGRPVVPDTIDGHQGPLAGILAGMLFAQRQSPNTAWILSLPADTPFLPTNLAASMHAAVVAGGADMACARSRGRNHPVIGLWPVALAGALERALGTGMRKIDRWTAQYNLVPVAFETDGHDPFFNINRPEDCSQASSLAQTLIDPASGRARG